jgi:hypothetical protein
MFSLFFSFIAFFLDFSLFFDNDFVSFELVDDDSDKL